MTDVENINHEDGEDDLLNGGRLQNKENVHSGTDSSNNRANGSKSISESTSGELNLKDDEDSMEIDEESVNNHETKIVLGPKEELKPANGVTKKKTQSERQLEINMTSKVTCPALDKTGSPEGSSPSNTSRYGRARKQKTIADFYPTDVALAMKKTMHSPVKSPTKQNKSPKTIKTAESPVKSHTKQNKSPQIIKTTPVKIISISKSPKKLQSQSLTNGSTEKKNDDTKLVYTPWNECTNKTHMKVYSKKDMIQRKLDEKEETSNIMRSMFSIKSPTVPESRDPIEKSPVKKSDKISPPRIKQQASPSPVKKIQKSKVSPIGNLKSPKKTVTPVSSLKGKTTLNSHTRSAEKTASPVKTVHFPDSDNAASNVDSVSSVMIKKDYIQKAVVQGLSEEIMEIEKNCIWKLGDLAWARVGSHPFWPCLITRDPVCSLFVRQKAVGRSVILADVIHVTFFADSGRRSWVTSNLLMKFSGLDAFNKIKTDIPQDMKKKDPKFCNAFNVTTHKKVKWLSAVSEAEMLLRRPAELREEFFILMFLNSEYCAQAMEKPKKQKIAKIQKDTDSTASLSESLFDSLFACEKSPLKNKAVEEQDNSKENLTKKSNSVDMSDIFTACLDNMTTKIGNEQIKVQSHMDRWLMKAKQPKDNANKLSLSRKKKVIVDHDSPEINTIVVEIDDSKSSESRIPLKKRKLSPATSPVKMYASNDILATEIFNESVKRKLDISEGMVVSSPYKVSSEKKVIEIPESRMTNEDKSKDVIVIEVNTPTKKSSNEVEDLCLSKNSNRNKEIKDVESFVDESNSITITSTPNVKRLRSHHARPITKSPDMNNCTVNSMNGDTATDDEKELSEPAGASRKKNNLKYEDPEFIQFLNQNQDDYLDSLPHMSENEFMSYMYKTWEYRKVLQTDKTKDIDEVCLVKGMSDDIEPTPPKKIKRRIKNPNEEPSSPVAVREKPQRKASIKSYFNDRDSDDEDSELNSLKLDNSSQQETKSSSTVKLSKKLDAKLNEISDKDDKSSPNMKTGKIAKKIDKLQVDEMKTDDGPVSGEEEPVLDAYMDALKITKPNLFKGLPKERVCEICENPTGLVKCKGPCGGMYHLLCVQKQSEPSSTEDVDSSARRKKKRKKSSYAIVTKKKYNSNRSDGDIDKLSISLNESLKSGAKRKSRVVTGNSLNGEMEIPPSPNGNDSCVGHNLSNGRSTPDNSDENVSVTSSVHIVANAIDFESQLSQKMQEIIDNMATEDISQDVSSASSSAEVCDWNGLEAGECVIEDANQRKSHNREETATKTHPSDSNADPDTFKCNDCQRYDMPPCFICKSITSPKADCKDRQRCSVTYCNKFFHMECLKAWPQTKYTTSGISKYVKKGQVECQETLSCPRHVCHTCVSDDPQGCKTRFSSDKLARCVRCPATYHCFTQCVPAGTKIITASQIICPKHCDLGPSKRAKIPYHVNTAWCFICAKGGSLICCETCPTSFHSECLNISPPEGGFICEECETGRLPLYGEIVWVKLGQYRWWPALVLHPSEVPPNINALAHAPGQFAVRFFGGYDHYWVSSGRVFPYQEGDTGHASSKRSAIDSAFMTAIHQAQQAFSIIKSLKEGCADEGELKSSLLPPQYIKLKINRVVGGLKLTAGEGATPRCGCDPQSERPCAPDSDCLNRMLLTECSAGVCAAGDRCCNQAFEKRLYPHLAPSRTAHRGWGLKTLVDIKKGDFVIEYVGEVIDEAEFQRRMARRQEMRDENYYFLTLDKDRMIDAGPKGNVARFMNHCCEPNCETQKWTVNGDTRVGLFALEDISADTEVTFNYNLTCAGDDKKTCLCGAKRCAGFIGAKLKQEEPLLKKSKKLLQKRRKKRKITAKHSELVTSSPTTTKKDPALSKVRRKPVTITKEERKEEPKERIIDPNSIEADVILINKAVADAAETDNGGRMEEDNKSLSPATYKLLNGNCTFTDNKPVVSHNKMDENLIIRNNKSDLKKALEVVDLNEKVLDCTNDDLKHDEANSKAVKRKRCGLQSDDSSNPKCSPIDKMKRPRSNSVYFSKSITYIDQNGAALLEDVRVLIDTSPVDKHRISLQNGHVSPYLIDGRVDLKASDSVHNTSSSNDSLLTKKSRGRPRKSV